jgi:hypothetical protein
MRGLLGGESPSHSLNNGVSDKEMVLKNEVVLFEDTLDEEHDK